MSPKSLESEVVFNHVGVNTLPKFSDLKREVDSIVKTSCWWDTHGIDWAIHGIFLMLIPLSFILMRSDSYLIFALGIFLLGWAHSNISGKAWHITAHGGLVQNSTYKRILSVVLIEVIGTFSADVAYDNHVKLHHPYTNIIGLGDSSTWRVSFLPKYVYMFVAPLLIPLLTVPISISGLIRKGNLLTLLRYILLSGLGLSGFMYILMNVSNLSFCVAAAVIWISRGMFAVPYVHINIFQHIGLPMYSEKYRPDRLYQMTTGVMNMSRNCVMDYVMGHSGLSCHIEHHLFPRLSDNMCLKIKPVVSKFLRRHGLPYNESTYMDRLAYFLDNFDALIVNAPPITHFVGHK